MTVRRFVTVRRTSDAPFGVMPQDLICQPTEGYDLNLMRSIARDGLAKTIVVRPHGDGRFRVMDGRKRVAAIQMLVRMNKMVYDKVTGLMRPASKVFALLRCRIRPRSAAPIPASVSVGADSNPIL